MHRLIPAASSGLSKPASAASCASRRTTASCWLLVFGQTMRFQVHAVANDHDAVESRTRFGTVPGDELIDGIFVNSTRGRRTEAVEHGPLTMIQIWQSK